MKAKRIVRFPKPARKPIAAHGERTVAELLATCEILTDEWWAQTAKAAIALAAYTGLRPTDVRLTRLADLDTTHWEIRVSNPKGLGRYATGDERCPIRPPAWPIVRDYLDAREAFLRRLGFDPNAVEPLFPFWNRCSTRKLLVGYWKLSSWVALKKAIEGVSGVPFRWKDLRPTFGQIAKDRGVPIEVVSKALRHTSTATTEAYYARIRSEAAFEPLRRAFLVAPVEPSIPR